MLLRGRIYLNARTMKEQHGDLFSTEKAAERAREKFGDVWARLRKRLADDPKPWSRARWQRPGQGNKLQWGIWPTAELEAECARIVAEEGEPVYWHGGLAAAPPRTPPALFLSVRPEGLRVL